MSWKLFALSILFILPPEDKALWHLIHLRPWLMISLEIDSHQPGYRRTHHHHQI